MQRGGAPYRERNGRSGETNDARAVYAGKLPFARLSDEHRHEHAIAMQGVEAGTSRHGSTCRGPSAITGRCRQPSTAMSIPSSLHDRRRRGRRLEEQQREEEVQKGAGAPFKGRGDSPSSRPGPDVPRRVAHAPF